MTDDIRYGAASEVGLVREANEDSKLHEPPLFVVADGMGGHSAGEVASQLAIETLSERVIDGEEALTSAVREANNAIYAKASEDPGLTGMGTTITAMYAKGDSVQIAHVGDSRAYLLRDGELKRLTRDHTVVGRMVEQGRLTEEEAERHPQRHIMERALGLDPNVEIDVDVVQVMPGDRILLCSDGLHGMIDEASILEILLREDDPGEASKKLCAEAVDAGGHDNVTAIVVDYPSAGGRRTAAPAVAASNPAKGRARKPTVYALAVVIALAITGAVASAAIGNSWYVGERSGKVTIFKGIQGSVLGMELSKPQATTDVRVADLPEIYQERVRESIKAKDLEDARSIVANLRREATALTTPTSTVTPALPAPTASP